MGLAPTISVLDIADDPRRWRDAGFTVDEEGSCRVGTVHLQLSVVEGARGVQGWTVSTDTCPTGERLINGLPTTVVAPSSVVAPSFDFPSAADAAPPHANGTRSIDHLVVFSPSLDVTVAALEGLGLEPRRTRRHEAFGQPMRQVFFRMGEVVLELVGPEQDGGEGDARFFGLAFTVGDLEATASFLGEQIGRIKGAVQPGRSIATLRRTAGLETAVAFMTPEPSAPRPPA